MISKKPEEDNPTKPINFQIKMLCSALDLLIETPVKLLPDLRYFKTLGRQK